jgi:molecular chaperone GrpE (heat shock protein)
LHVLNGGRTTADQVTVVEAWAKVRDYVNRLSVLNDAIDHFEQGRARGDEETTFQYVIDRYTRNLKSAADLSRTASRYDAIANKALAIPDPKEQKPEGEPKPEEQAKPPKPTKQKPLPPVNPPAKKKPAPEPEPLKEVTPAQVKRLAADRTVLIDDIIGQMEKSVGKAQAALVETVITDFVDTLDQNEDGTIKNTLANKRKLQTLERVYNKFVSESGIEVVNTIIKGVSDVMNFNGKYFGVFTQPAQLGKIMAETKTAIGDWLGITNRGGLVENGYLNKLLTDQGIRNTIKDSMFKSIVSQKGYQATKSALKDYIAGNQQQTGALQKYYRNFVYDTFSQVDRTQQKMFADKLKMTYAIYEGGLIKTSRAFCKARNGKVFSSEEIEKFDPKEAKPPNYNPFTDLGGYGCRHHLNWIPETLAFALRPDLRQAATA